MDFSKLEKISHLISQEERVKCRKGCKSIIEHQNVRHLGIIEPNNFRSLMHHCKYLLGFGNPRKTPTMMEALCECDTIILAPESQATKDLSLNKNYYDTNGMSVDEVVDLINKIESNQIVFDKQEKPRHYSMDTMERNLREILALRGS